MQAGILSERSYLLSREGWFAVGVGDGKLEVAGIDRFGKVTFQEIEKRRTSTVRNPIFLGTSRSCGLFSPLTCIQESSGHSRMAGTIVAKMLIGDLRFEQVLRVDIGAQEHCPIARLWAALCNEAAFSDNSALAIRCRSTARFRIAKTLGHVVERNDRRYLVLRRKDLESTALSEGGGAVWAEVCPVFLNEDSYLEFGRASCYLAMEAARAMSLAETSYQIAYDSLQHTSLIQVQVGATDGSSLGRGACAHVIAGETFSDIELSWQSNFWNPICNGVVLLKRQEDSA